ncbi:cob(I)yrinic acid a,c-diamide adenosyltransferase [Alkalitalea saponilacus]|uniref:corrinoid adenosyltransferase n=1 Tax=Alkalitalea saponilacus TaxID=889453 RepID=A0A1T5C8T0_9BACT|nr:cob(I)yrinic acid a,c-diamide adenosyltransferase [Alkalitalea saponilacus]ASB49772.1 cob(I)yrinic acid a,c-diamide adenosyltransferase [Alkalitalea saponilacus]SKB55799.1 cob(I)alamin adenosyltransferase [Alkalitalea saponilacus]
MTQSTSENGYIQVYTGNGKGKSTAAFGLSLRAVGAGKKVFFCQFVKGKIYSEIEAIRQYLPNITLKQYGRGCFIYKKPDQADIDAAKEGLQEISEIVKSSEYDLIVLDEANIALYYNLFQVDDLIEILKQKHSTTEVVITGRYAPQELMDFADLVTEMKEIKHYYTKGVEARKGIEF